MARAVNFAVLLLMLASAVADTTTVQWGDADSGVTHADEDAANLMGRQLLGNTTSLSLSKQISLKAEQKVYACKAKCKGSKKSQSKCRSSCSKQYSKFRSQIKKCESNCYSFAYKNKKNRRKSSSSKRSIYNKCFKGC